MSLLSAVLEAEAKARASVVNAENLENVNTSFKNVKFAENGTPVIENVSKKFPITASAIAATESLATDAIEALTARYVRVSGSAITKIPSSELLTKRRQHLLDTGTSPHHHVALQLEAAAIACEWSDRAQDASRLLERRKWKSAAEKLRSLASDLDTPNDLIPKSLVKGIREFVSTKRARCLAHVTAQWKSIFKWSATPEVIILRINVSDRENLQEILNALHVSERIDAEIANFAYFFLKSVVPALVFKKSSIVVDDELGVVRIEIRPGDRIENADEISTVVDILVLFFETVQSNIDCKWEDYRTVFSIFGQIAAEEFFDSFSGQFLQLEDKTSTDSRSAKECLRTANEIEKFGNYLCEIGFVEQETNPLLNYTEKYYDFQYNKRCEKLLHTAREAMKDNPTNDIVKICIGQTDSSEIKMFEKDVNDKDLLYFPFMMSECHISARTRDLLELIFSELETLQNLSLKFGNKLIQNLKMIFALYNMLVPFYHSDAIKNDPLTLALYYNNCFYLAHGIIGYLWNKNFPNEFATYVNIQLTDQIYKLRLSAITQFSMFIKNEQTSIENIIAKSDLNSFEKTDAVRTNGEVAISKCIERLVFFRSIWKDILCEDHCEKALGELVDCLSKELVQCVMMVKEGVIGEDLADDLSSKFSSVVSSIPSLFNDKCDVRALSKNYCRLVEITLLLKCPMFTVANKWKNSEEISKIFTCQEIKHFVKIMYPSSIQKSTVLNTIQ